MSGNSQARESGWHEVSIGGCMLDARISCECGVTIFIPDLCEENAEPLQSSVECEACGACFDLEIETEMTREIIGCQRKKVGQLNPVSSPGECPALNFGDIDLPKLSLLFEVAENLTREDFDAAQLAARPGIGTEYLERIWRQWRSGGLGWLLARTSSREIEEVFSAILRRA